MPTATAADTQPWTFSQSFVKVSRITKPSHSPIPLAPSVCCPTTERGTWTRHSNTASTSKQRKPSNEDTDHSGTECNRRGRRSKTFLSGRHPIHFGHVSCLDWNWHGHVGH